jgi:hypothetical protein
MTTNLNDILAQFHKLCRELIESVNSLPKGSLSFDVESMILERVHSIGAEAMKAYLAAQAPYYHYVTASHPDGSTLRYSGERSGLLYSIFGEIAFKRSYYCGNEKGTFPMDAGLNLPLKGASDLHRKMAEELSLSMSYEDATAFLAKYFPVATSTRALQEAVRTDSVDAGAYYDQAPPPIPAHGASILVVQGDGKGVPVVKQGSVGVPEPGKRKGPPQREGKKKEATLVSVSTHSPFIRTAEQVIASLFDGERGYDGGQLTVACKREWATMHGKQRALARAQTWVAQLDGDHIEDYVLLCDGLPSLQRALCEAFPGHTLVLDLMHVLGYLWDAASIWFKGTGASERDWVRNSVSLMLQGKALSVVEEVEEWSKAARVGKIGLEGIARYLRRNLGAMAYDQYLAKGWPIATGMIEGACRHIVKDRCERSGMRWTTDGVEAILHLRCLYANDDWDAYHDFRMAQRQRLVYRRTPQPTNRLYEANVYKINEDTTFALAV